MYVAFKLGDYKFNIEKAEEQTTNPAVFVDSCFKSNIVNDLLPSQSTIIVKDRQTDIESVLFLKTMQNAKQNFLLRTNKGDFETVIENVQITQYKTYFDITIVLQLYSQLQFPQFKFIRIRGSMRIDISEYVAKFEIETEVANLTPLAIMEISNKDDINAQVLRIGDEVEYYAGHEDLLLRAVLSVDVIESTGNKTEQKIIVRLRLASAKSLCLTKQILEKIWPNTVSVYTIIMDETDGLLVDTGISGQVSSDLQTRYFNDDFTFHAGEAKDEILTRLVEQLKEDFTETWFAWTDRAQHILYMQPCLISEETDFDAVWGQEIMSKDMYSQEGEFFNWILGYGEKLETTHETGSYRIIYESDIIFESHCITYAGDQQYIVGSSDTEGILLGMRGETAADLFHDSDHLYTCCASYGVNYLLIGHREGIVSLDCRAFTLGGEEILSGDLWGLPMSSESTVVAIDDALVPHSVFIEYSSPYRIFYAQKILGVWEQEEISGLKGNFFDLVYDDGKLYLTSIGYGAYGLRLNLISKSGSGLWTGEYFEGLVHNIGASGYNYPRTRFQIKNEKKYILYKPGIYPIDYDMRIHYFDGIEWKNVDPVLGQNGDISVYGESVCAVGLMRNPDRVIFKIFNTTTESWDQISTIESTTAYLVSVRTFGAHIHVAYYTENGLKYAYSENGTSWSIQTISTEDIGSSMFLRLDFNENVYISYRDTIGSNPDTLRLILYYSRDKMVWYKKVIHDSQGYGAHFCIDSENCLNFAYTYPRMTQQEYSHYVYYLRWKSTIPVELVETGRIVDFAEYEGFYVAIDDDGMLYQSSTPLLAESWRQFGQPISTPTGIEIDEYGTIYAAGGQVIKKSMMPLSETSSFSEFIALTDPVTTLKKVVNVLYAITECGDVYSFTDSDLYKLEGAGDWYKPGFSKRKKVTVVSASSGCHRTFLIKKGSGTDTNNEVYCICEDDFSDIRFTDEYGDNLSYWIQDGSLAAGTQCRVWIQLGAVEGSSITLHMYYGNPSAQSESSFDNTFSLRDSAENGQPSERWIVSGDPPDIEVDYVETPKYEAKSVKVNVLDEVPEKVARLREFTYITKGRVRWWQWIPAAASGNEVGIELRATPGTGENRIAYIIFYNNGQNIKYYQNSAWYYVGSTWQEEIWEHYELRFDQADYSVSLYREQSGVWTLLKSGIKCQDWTGELNDFTVRHYAGTGCYNLLDNVFAAKENTACTLTWLSEEQEPEEEGSHGMTGKLAAVDSCQNNVLVAYGEQGNMIKKQILLPGNEAWSLETVLPLATEIKEMQYSGEDSFLILQDNTVSLGTPASAGMKNIARVARDLTSINQYGKRPNIATSSCSTVNETDLWVIDLLLKSNLERRGGQIRLPLLNHVVRVNSICNLQAGADSGYFSVTSVRDEASPQNGAITILNLGRTKVSYKEVFRTVIRSLTGF